MHPARGSAESSDIREDRGTIQSKFSRVGFSGPRVPGKERSPRVVRRSEAIRKTPPPATASLLPEHSSGSEFHVVHLRLFKEGARKVCVAGTFNDWNPQRAPLQRNPEGEWEIALSLAPGDYEYRFVVDDEWMDDPLACREVANPFGGVNAVVHVHGS